MINRTKLEFRLNESGCPHKLVDILAIIPGHKDEFGARVLDVIGTMNYREVDHNVRIQDEHLLAKLQPEHARSLYEALKKLFDPNTIPQSNNGYCRYDALDCAECVKNLEEQHKEASKRFQELSRLVSNYVTVTIDRKS